MPTKKIQQIILQAIASELEAYDYYSFLAQQMQDQESVKICQCLAEEEWQHREALQRLLEQGLTAIFEAAQDFPLNDLQPAPKLSAEMKPAEALQLAIQKEIEAARDYTILAQLSKKADQKELFQRLAAMEQGHKVYLEKIYRKMFA